MMDKDSGRSPADAGSGQRPFGVEPPSGVSSIAATPNAFTAKLVSVDFESREIMFSSYGIPALASGVYAIMPFDQFDHIAKLAAEFPELDEAARETFAKYHELLFAVARKYEGEDRHETALRYIREREADLGPPLPGCGIVSTSWEDASAAGARSAETNEDSAQSVGRQSGPRSGRRP